MAPHKDGRIMRTASARLNPPSTALDKVLYGVVLLLWICVGVTWARARARLAGPQEAAGNVEEVSSGGSLLSAIDWWTTRRASLKSSSEVEANLTRKFKTRNWDPSVSTTSAGVSIASQGGDVASGGSSAKGASSASADQGAKGVTDVGDGGGAASEETPREITTDPALAAGQDIRRRLRSF